MKPTFRIIAKLDIKDKNLVKAEVNFEGAESCWKTS